MSTWATIADVNLYTGIAVSQDLLVSAQFLVELFVDLEYNDTIDASGNPITDSSGRSVVGTRDMRYLKMAVAYQAAWMTDHPDLFTQVDIGSMNQDGVFFVYKNENAALQAPMTRRALNRLSWKRSSNIRLKPSRNRFINKRYVQESVCDTEIIPTPIWEQM